MNHLNPEQMTVEAFFPFFFSFPQETVELEHSTVVWPRWGPGWSQRVWVWDQLGHVILHFQASPFFQF